jgi:hypothetical protein
MSRIVICFITLFSFTPKNFNSCTNKPTDKQIRAVNMTYDLPVVNWDSTITETKSMYDVFYYEDLIMYKFLYRFDSLVNGKLLLHADRNIFFVFRRDSLFGNTYDPNPHRRIPDRRLRVDSMLKIYSFESSKFDTLLNFKPDSSYFDAEGNLLKIYINPAPDGSPEKFDLYFYYTKKLQGIKETFSKSMDNIKNMKLFKVRILASGAYYEQYKIAFPKREIYYEMKKIPVENTEAILDYFNRYKKLLE